MGDKPRIIMPGDGDGLIEEFMKADDNSLLIVKELEPVFFELLKQAARVQKSDVSEFAMRYIAEVMAAFSKPEILFDIGEDGYELQPLAFIYGEAVETEGQERVKALKKLGDTALFRGGFMADYYKRKPVDVDYCINMGEAAYSSISEMIDEETIYAGHGEGLFSELSSKFGACVDLMAEIASKAQPQSDNDFARQYELWMKTGSKRSAGKLLQAGINVMDTGGPNGPGGLN